METNETAKGAQYQEAEQELMKLLEEVEGIAAKNPSNSMSTLCLGVGV